MFSETVAPSATRHDPDRFEQPQGASSESAGSLDAHVQVRAGQGIAERLPAWEALLLCRGEVPLSKHPAWLRVLNRGLGHTCYCLEALQGEKLLGFLPLSFLHTWLFGKYLVSLPYLNYGGPITDRDEVASTLVDRAVQLADELGAKFLEIRDTRDLGHPRLSHRMTSKVHLKLAMPPSSEVLWKQLDAKVRNQIRKGQKSGLNVAWGRAELLGDFYTVFSRNMRDLGTPVYGKRFFAEILQAFPERAEFCVVRKDNKPVAGAVLFHGWGVTEVPSASSLREYNATNANMLMYWHLLERTIARGNSVFDFGRSSEGSNTYKFKTQWGAQPHPAIWQYYLRTAAADEMRTENPRYQRRIRLWQRLPVFLTRWLGPHIVRGIP
jgi:FemAB-related protein (PEP-CTERM system-associated)